MPTHLYVLEDPRTGQVRYVGKTKRNPRQRLRGHIVDAKRYDYRSGRWITSLLDQGLEPVIRVLETVEEGWQARERFWIKNYREAGAELTNHTDGGEGTDGFQHTTETRRAMSAERQRRWQDPSYKERVRAQMRVSANDPCVKSGRIASVKRVTNQPEVRAKRSATARAQCADPAVREMKLRILAESRQKPETSKKIAETSAARWQDPDYKARVGAKISEAKKIWYAKKREAEHGKVRPPRPETL